jgi:hypothetical protein
MEDVSLEIVDALLEHGNLDNLTLASLGMVDKGVRELVMPHVSRRKAEYQQSLSSREDGRFVLACHGKRKLCSGCDRVTVLRFPFHQELPMCTVCMYAQNADPEMRLVSATFVRNNLYLLEDDQRVLQVFATKHSRFFTGIRMFCYRDALEAALAKHGGPAGVSKLRHAANVRLKRRIELKAGRHAFALKTLKEELGEVAPSFSDDAFKACCREYVKGGRGGKRGVRERAARFRDFSALLQSAVDAEAPEGPLTPDELRSVEEDRRFYVWSSHPGNIQHAAGCIGRARRTVALEARLKQIGCCLRMRYWPVEHEKYVDGINGVTLDDAAQAFMKAAQRRLNLMGALARHGIGLPGDSSDCADYIAGVHDDLENTVQLMRNFYK